MTEKEYTEETDSFDIIWTLVLLGLVIWIGCRVYDMLFDPIAKIHFKGTMEICKALGGGTLSCLFKWFF